MAKKSMTGDYDKNGDLEEAEVPAAATVPPPGTDPRGVPAGLPPESYMTAQEAHVAGGGEYAPVEETPPPEGETTRKAAKVEKK